MATVMIGDIMMLVSYSGDIFSMLLVSYSGDNVSITFSFD